MKAFFSALTVLVAKLLGVVLYAPAPPHHYNHFMALFPDYPREPVPKENFWALWCKGRLTEANTDHPAGRHSIRTNQCPPPPLYAPAV